MKIKTLLTIVIILYSIYLGYDYNESDHSWLNICKFAIIIIGLVVAILNVVLRSIDIVYSNWDKIIEFLDRKIW